MILIVLCALTQTKSVAKYIISMKGHNYNLHVHYLFLFCLTFTRKSQGARNGEQNLHVFEVTFYMIFTHPV